MNYYPKGLKRLLDFVIVLVALIVLLIPGLIIGFLIKCSSPGPIFYWSDRIGKDNKIFSMPKFRTMKINTPEVATHLLTNPDSWITPLGRFMRRTSLDEIPQLWSVLNGDMTLVGPRPALFNQYDLIALRKQRQVHELLPGLTGWAQINGRDDLSIEEKVRYDVEYLELKSLRFDLLILWRTVFKLLKADNVMH